MIDAEYARLGFTILATMASTLITIGRWFQKSIETLNDRIKILSDSIAELDKNVAVQTAIFDNYIKKGN